MQDVDRFDPEGILKDESSAVDGMRYGDDVIMTYDELKELLGVSELLSVTREQVEQNLESVLDLIDEGHSPILITADGKHDLLMFSWKDYKRRFSILYPPGELERIEEEMRRSEEKL